MSRRSAICLMSLVLMFLSTARGLETGATNTSCYTHFVRHFTPFNSLVDSANCGTSSKCNPIVLTPTCIPDADDVCCPGFSNRILYTNCSYMFQWNTASTLGFLLQARIINGLGDRSFDVNAIIVGIWDNSTLHQPVYCRNSGLANESEPSVPNSVTHTSFFENNAPPNINMTWYTYDVNPTNQSENETSIAFFYTISRQETSNFFPYTTNDLVFTLKTNPGPMAETTPSSTTAIPTSTVDPDKPTIESELDTIGKSASPCLRSPYGLLFSVLSVLLILIVF